MSKFSEYIGSQFGNPHGIIGRVCCIIMNAINNRMYKRTIDFVTISSGDRVLDIGYGNGYLLRLMDRAYSPEMYGIDISEDMLIHASQKNRTADCENRLHLSVGDCCELPYENDFFSAVTSVNTIYFWSDPVKGLTEILRCLKGGGVFCNAVYSKKWLDSLSYTRTGFKKYETEQLVELGYQAGFAEVEVKEISKGKSFAVIYKKQA